jgi:hypothetical protein
LSGKFVDSYAILPAALRKLSESFKPKHQKLAFDDYSKIAVDDPDTLKYLENDVLCLWEILYDFFSSDFIKTPALTIASQALSTFQYKFFDGKLQGMKLPLEEMIRERFYSGGRVEAYKGYGKRVHVYDVNSLYPYCMTQPMPTGEVRYTARYNKTKIGFYHVDIHKTPDWYISPLLYRGKKLLFVNGGGEYFLGSPTLAILNEQGVRFKILDGYVFDGKEDLFSDYVSFFHDLKTRSKGTAMYYVAKLFLNSLYGKFGMARERWTVQRATGYEEGAAPLMNELDSYGMCMVKEQTRSKFVMPYIAAYITELARCHHWRLMNQHPESVFYCDTDSIFTSHVLPAGGKLGELSDEGTFEGVFLGNKTYALRNGKSEKVAFKGFHVEDIHFRDVEKVLRTHKPLIQKRTRILSFRECLKRKEGIVSDAGPFLKMVDMTKETDGLNDKRRLTASRTHIYDSMPFARSELP